MDPTLGMLCIPDDGISFPSVVMNEHELRVAKLACRAKLSQESSVVKILVFPQNGMRPCYYGVKSVGDIQQIVKDTYKPEHEFDVFFGYVTHMYNGWRVYDPEYPSDPFTHLSPRLLNDNSWEEFLYFFDPAYMTLAVWLVKTPRDIDSLLADGRVPSIFRIFEHPGGYQWGHDVLFWKTGHPDEMANAYTKQVFGVQEDPVGNYWDGHMMTSSLPCPYDIEFDRHPSVDAYSEDALLQYKFKVRWLVDKCEDALEILNKITSHEIGHLIADEKHQKVYVMRRPGFDGWNMSAFHIRDTPGEWIAERTSDREFPGWLCMAAVALGSWDVVDRLIEWDSHCKKADTFCSGYLMKALKESAAETLLAHHACHGILREDQRHVLATMVARETQSEKAFEATLFVDVLTSEDTSVTLCRSSFYNNVTVRRTHAPKKKTAGGFFIAPMGFGKTVVILSLVESQPRTGPTLVVCPSAVVAQWKSMCASKTSLKAYTHIGPKRRKADADDIPIPDEDIVFTSYDIVKRRDTWVKNVQWARVVFDESHVITTDVNENACKEINAPLRWCMTASVDKEEPLSRQIKVLLQRGNDGYYAERQYMFLRTCSVVGGRPWDDDDQQRSYSVSHERVSVTMPTELNDVYRAVCSDARVKGWTMLDKCVVRILRKVSAGCMKPPSLLWKGEGSSGGGVKRSSTVFVDDECSICMGDLTEPMTTPCGHTFCRVCLMTALQVKPKCPLCRQKTTWNRTVELAKAQEIAHLHEQQQQHVDAVPDRWDTYRSTTACEMIRELAADNKYLIFSHYDDLLTKTMTLLADQGVQCVTMGSHTPIERRQACLDQFATDPECRVMCLNLRWANAGLNLASANRLIFMESVPNKTHYEQAVGRIARAGQTRDVVITTLTEEIDGY
jgi:hypothetical protein